MTAKTCDFLGCTQPDYPWQMCAACYDMACEWDDSESCDVCGSFCGGINCGDAA